MKKIIIFLIAFSLLTNGFADGQAKKTPYVHKHSTYSPLRKNQQYEKRLRKIITTRDKTVKANYVIRDAQIMRQYRIGDKNLKTSYDRQITANRQNQKTAVNNIKRQSTRTIRQTKIRDNNIKRRYDRQDINVPKRLSTSDKNLKNNYDRQIVTSQKTYLNNTYRVSSPYQPRIIANR